MLRTRMRRPSETRVGQSGAQGPNTEGACVPGNDREGERNKRNDWTHRCMAYKYTIGAPQATLHSHSSNKISTYLFSFLYAVVSPNWQNISAVYLV
ncbi:hypothetical protein XENTR_v10018000 [Xenopus tropicalis]|nr:hypothetical protein XENTR_v10018000 [Xenopus tropicalis]